MATDNFVLAVHIATLLVRADAAGLDRDGLLADVGFDSGLLSQPAAPLPLAAFAAVLERCEAATGDPLVAAHPGQTLLFEHPTRPGIPAWRGVAEASTAFWRHMAALGIAGAFKPLHGYRAGMATLALNDINLPASALRDQLGHTDLQTTLRYYVAGMGDAQLATVDALRGALADAEPWVRGAAAWALGQLGPQAPPAVTEWLRAALDGPERLEADPQVRAELTAALAALAGG